MSSFASLLKYIHCCCYPQNHNILSLFLSINSRKEGERVVNLLNYSRIYMHKHSPHICFIINLQPIAWTHPVLVMAHVYPVNAIAKLVGEVMIVVLSTKMCSNVYPDVLTMAYMIWIRVHVFVRNIGLDQIVHKVSTCTCTILFV